MEKFPRGAFFFEITDVDFSFEPSPPHNSQRIDGNQQHNEDNTYYHILSHTDTCSHNQTQPNTNKSQTHHPFPAQIQAHFIRSGTRLAQLHQDSCFLHDANIIARQGMGQSTRTPTLSPVRAVSTQRELGRVIIVIVTERGEKREENDGREERREERRRETRKDRNEKRQKERHTEGQTEHERREKAENPSVCRFKTPPCVRSGRLRVYPENARMFNTTDRDLETKKVHAWKCAPRSTMILHSIKIWIICNDCNFMRTLLFLELISSAKIFLYFLLAEMVLELINDLHL